MLFSECLQGGEHLVRRGRDTGDTGSGGIEDRVEDGRVRRIQRGLAAAGSTVGAGGTIGLVVDELDVIRDVLDVRDAALEQAGVLRQIFEVLGQRKADALCQAAVEVAVVYM